MLLIKGSFLLWATVKAASLLRVEESEPQESKTCSTSSTTLLPRQEGHKQ